MIDAKLFSQASWLTPARVRRFAVVFAVMAALLLAGDAWMHSRAGVTDGDGIPLGRDFINYWSGAQLAAHGHAVQAYDLKAFVAFERAHTAANATLRWYSYPPVALLLSLPLALTGFISGLIAWLLAGYALNAVLLARSLDRRWALLAAFATPAALMNALSGQNGAFSAALFAGAVLSLQRRPWLAGALLGLLAFKPHLAVLVPLALAMGRHGRAFAGAALSALGVCLASALLFGPQVWTDFLHNAPFNVTVLETGIGFWPRMPTPFATMMELGTGLRAAYGAQIVSGLFAAAITALAWRTQAPVRVKGAVLVLATFLVTPYAWDYDLVAVTFAVAWLVREARETGFLPYEKFVLALAIGLPLLTMPFLAATGVQPGFLFLWPALIVAARRAILSRAPVLGHATALC
jgi:hypothetical protein